jgi:hypothetical protein
MSLRQPKYRRHKARNCAVVTIAGQDHYLGEYDSPASWEKYHRLVAESLAAKPTPSTRVDPETPRTVTELVAAYWRFVKSYYVKAGRPTSERDAIRHALRFLRRLYGSTSAKEFGPKKLQAVRDAMIAHRVVRRYRARDPKTGAVIWAEKLLNYGLARTTINRQIGRIRRAFGWAVEEELIPVDVHAALLRVRGLRKNKSGAREKARVRPVCEAHIEVVLPHVPPMVADMI